MDHDAKKPQPERDQTDQSLRTERSNADDAMAERRTGVEENADELVERAREHADAVLDTARYKADEKLDGMRLGAREREVVIRERAREDRILVVERAAADDALRREREEQARTLAALLPLEREQTDRFLLTERARSDDALAHRDDFLGMVSHDLRNLLSGIALNATLLAEDASASDEGRRTVVGMRRIQGYVARMNRLIGDLVDVASIDAGKLAVLPDSSGAAALLGEAVDIFALAAKEKGITLESPHAGSALMADFDHDRMLQVLANLLANAIKFTPRGGTIVARGEAADEDLHFSVSDTGTGIPVEMLEAVFERFWQVGKNDKRGLGLGLYISKCLVDAHGGRIWAESELGKGSTFHVTIPASAPHTIRTLPASSR